jgi:hypothetical protein
MDKDKDLKALLRTDHGEQCGYYPDIPVALLAYIYSGKLLWDAGEIVTTVPQGNILLVTGLISKVAITAVPMVMAIAAFSVADRWLQNSLAPSHTPDLPTPYQYSLLLKAFQGANIFSAWSFIQYAIRTPNRRRATLSSPLVTYIILYSLGNIDYCLGCRPSRFRPPFRLQDFIDPAGWESIDKSANVRS